MLRTLLTTTLMLTATLAFVPGANAWACTPVSDGAAAEVRIGSYTYYEKLYRSGGYWIQETWQESNGEFGLQSSTGMSCVGKTDKLLGRACLGLCPIHM